MNEPLSACILFLYIKKVKALTLPNIKQKPVSFKLTIGSDSLEPVPDPKKEGSLFSRAGHSCHITTSQVHLGTPLLELY